MTVQMDKIMGKRILVGITNENSGGGVEKSIQFHGIVIEANEQHLLIRNNQSDEVFSLRPDYSSIREGKKAIYTLHSTGEKVENPDYVTTWTVMSPKKKGKKNDGPAPDPGAPQTGPGDSEDR